MTEADGLESLLGHHFEDPERLREALHHRSWVAEIGEGISNDRLEFLGDAVLQLVVTDYVFARYPDYNEGQMTKIRASVVSKDALFEYSLALGLGAHLLLGRGEEVSGGRSKASILANAMEAVIGAVYVDGGLAPARSLILRLMADRILQEAGSPGRGDYKSRLQEQLAVEGGRPSYRISATGPDHEKVFTASVSIEGTEWGVGMGASKRDAEQDAARRALEALDVAMEDRE